MNKPRLRFIITSLDIGGTEIHLSTILPELAKKGWCIDLFVLDGQMLLYEHFKHKNIHIYTISRSLNKWIPSFLKSPLYLFRTIFMLKKAYKEYPKVPTFFFLPKAYIIGMITAKLFRYKGLLLMSRRSSNIYQKKYFLIHSLEKLLHKHCYLILANSQAVQHQLIELENVPAEKVKLIYNGAREIKNFNISKIQCRKELNYNSESFLMVCLANLKFIKGQQDLINSLNLIKDKLPKNWYLILLGKDQGTKDTLIKLIEKYNFEERIIFEENCHNPFIYLHAADLGILPSHSEGFSNALIEMMSTRLPIIATNVGGNSEAIEHNKSGLIIDKQSNEQLANAILKFANDKNMRKEYGEAAYIRYKENFLFEKCLKAYEELCSDISQST